LTTANAKDIIVACVAIGNSGGGGVGPAGGTVSSISDAAGLTWNLRKAVSAFGGSTDLEVWWAFSSGMLSSDVITANLSQAVDDACINVFAVSGANTASPWDTNASLPKSSSSLTNPCTISGVSTDSSNTMLLGFWGNDGVFISLNAGTGFTLTDHNGTSVSGDAGSIASEYKIVSSPQSSVSVAFGSNANSAFNAIMIADAIRAPWSSPAPRRVRNFIDRRQ
jgi:hypothetical protein